MEEIAKFGHSAIKASQTQMEYQANRHRQEALFKEGDLVMLLTKNIKIIRPSKDLDAK